jgi:predicted RNA-binding Zn-ribbon protein involved in translation (DUF1610 family)
MSIETRFNVPCEDNEIRETVMSLTAQSLLEQPELLIEEQTSFPCPCCGEELDSHTDQALSKCLGYDD